MEQYGNKSSYNVESVLQKNIVDSEYFRDTCGKLNSWSEVVDQIYYDVQSVEPWMSGNARGASTAFCLLYRSVSRLYQQLRSLISVRVWIKSAQRVTGFAFRLFTLQITEHEVKDLITHVDSPYIRAVSEAFQRVLLIALCHTQLCKLTLPLATCRWGSCTYGMWPTQERSGAGSSHTLEMTRCEADAIVLQPACTSAGLT